ncbi:MAG TPA: serine/threonine-protein kinase [Kofleriaceae bacterium]|nr:serine/threonine-protein kinase [Kofleriaceae bacterium]
MSSDKVDQPTIKVAITGDELGGEDRPAPAPDAIVAGRYKLGRRIGKGGMGEVMAARDEQVARDVAVKRMRSADPSEKAIRRFLREAMVQGRLEHPAVVPVHEIGRDADGLPFFVMKKLTGTQLAKLLEDRTSMPLQRVLRAFADVCLAVEFAHVRGVVHRDLKPDNIMLGDFGEVYVLDWGVAKIIGEAEDGDFADIGSGSGEHATRAGTAIGTPGYMAPEQVRGLADIDGRADVYTLGCLLFEILAGEPLHPRGQAGMEAALAGGDARPSVRAPDREIAPELDALCVAATQVERADRIQTARDLGERVERYLDGDRDLALRRSLARDHLDRARSAFAADSAENRRTAMREAAGALALDPALSGAAELVARLMLEPPRETPPEVTEAMHDFDVRDAKEIARAGLWAVIGTLLFLPLVFWMAPHASSVPLLTAFLLLDGAVAYLAIRMQTPRPGLVVIANTIIVITVARMFSPILIAPGVAASLGMAMVLTPRFSWLGSPVTIGVLMVGAILVPLGLELFGAVSETMSVSPQGVLFHGPALDGAREAPTIAVSALYAACLVGASVFAGYQMRARAVAAAKHLQMQAWQLRQLVPR